MNTENSKPVLVYVRNAGKTTDNTYIYDMFFSETPDYVWGPNWDVDNPSINGDLTPEETTYSFVKRVKTTLPLKTAEETLCYSMEYATYGILALSWINIDDLDIYPEHGRLTFHFGDDIDYVKEKLKIYNWNFE